MNCSHKVQFTSFLRGVALVGEKVPHFFSEEELEAATLAAYQKGAEETAELLQQQMAARLNEMVELEQGAFRSLEQQHQSLIDQLRQVIPDLVMETVRRIFSGFEIDRDTVALLVNEILKEVTPGRQALEVVLSPHDLELIREIENDFREKYPSIEFRADATLQNGDCIARTRFGVIDGRIATKLKTVESFLR